MLIERWPSRAPGRSTTVTAAGLVWTVANAQDTSADFEQQVAESLAMLERHLQRCGSARSHLISLQVLLADIGDRARFETLWISWIGPDAAHWPQRACYQANLAGGLRIELIAVAAPASAAQRVATTAP